LEKGASTPLTLVILFPSHVYNLQIASIIYLYLLPDLPKTGNHQKSKPIERAGMTEKDSRVLVVSLADFRKFGGALRRVEPPAREQY